MDFKERYEKMVAKEKEAKNERYNLEREFSDWLEKQENWKMFILCHIHATRSDYPDKDYIYKHMSPFIHDFIIMYDGSIRFDIKIYGESLLSSTYVQVDCRPEELLNFQDYIKADNEIVRKRIQEYEEDIKDYEEDMKWEIEKRKKEIERLKKWLE